jgi:hypothetical protein
MSAHVCFDCALNKRNETFLEHLRDCRAGPGDRFQRYRHVQDDIKLSLIEDVE